MNRILDAINAPSDLKRLSLAEMERLAAEIRTELVDTVSRTGGHLAPNLGVVELTLALHRVFDSPHDKLIFDVGHQTYAHKLVTGRRDRFATLRQAGGLSGFPRSGESPHDVWETGHASTSISAALGMARARDLLGERYRVVAVIGDGALTGGLALEALNHAGHEGTSLLVVLNDNELSYGPTVGGLAAHLSRLRAHPAYSRVRTDFQHLLKRFRSGKALARLTERLKGSVKHLLVPGLFFEELGFRYFGPIYGHRIALLEDMLRHVQDLQGPVLLHVVTRKGKGYSPAEANPDRFHGIGPFDRDTGQAVNCAPVPSYTEFFGQALLREGQADPRVVAVTAAMLDSTGLGPFAAAFPDRVFDVGIAEAHAVCFAGGLASRGMRPVVAVYSTFLQRAFDQILHDIGLQGLPVVLVLDRGGITGEDGATHQGIYDFGYLRGIPGMTIMAPRDENELQHMLFTALRLPGPVAIRFPRGRAAGVRVDPEPRAIALGEGQWLRHGQQGPGLLAIGNMVRPALQAAGLLAREGLDIPVVDARFVKPLDGTAIEELVRTHGALVTVEEHVLPGGFGSAVGEYLTSSGLAAQGLVTCMALPDRPLTHGPADHLRREHGLTAEGIAVTCRRLARAMRGGRLAAPAGGRGMAPGDA